MTPLTITGEYGLRCMVVPKPVPPDRLRTPTVLGTIEQNWRNLVPFFKKPVQQTGFVDPINSLESITKFIARVEELKLESQRGIAEAAYEAAVAAILEQQERELATEVDRARANGIDFIRLSSSPEDDDTSDVELTEADMKKYGVPMAIGDMSMEEAAPILRRIEWERYALACGNPSNRVGLTPEGGAVELARFASIPPAQVAEMGKRLKKAIEHDWAYGVETPTVAPLQRFEDEDATAWQQLHTAKDDPQPTRCWRVTDVLPAEDRPTTAGYSELGLHNFEDDELERPLNAAGRPVNQGAPTFEPSDSELENWVLDWERLDSWKSSRLSA